MDTKKIKHILIAETDRIGDVLLTLPVFKTIKTHNPQVMITALVREYTKDIFRHFKYADNVISYNNLKDTHEQENLLYNLRSSNIDTALILHPDLKIARFIKKAGIPNRLSYGWKWYQYLFTKVLIQHRSRNEKHQLEYNLELLSLLNIKEKTTDVRLSINKEDMSYINNYFKKIKFPAGKIIGIHPGSGHSSLNLPPQRYIELIEKIKRKNKNAEIVLTGSNQDKETIQYIIDNTKVHVNPMPLNLSLGHLIALISKMSLFISNSTGPMHIASILRVPIAAFFSPVFVHSPLRWGPYWGKKLIIIPSAECKEKWKCKGKNCVYHNCFETITFDKIIEFIDKNI